MFKMLTIYSDCIIFFIQLFLLELTHSSEKNIPGTELILEISVSTKKL